MKQINIEKIAETIRPKPTIIKGNYDESNKNTHPVLDADRPFHNVIYRARDIEDLHKRKDFLNGIIKEELSYSKSPHFVKPMITSVVLGGINRNLNLPDKVQRKTNSELIRQCIDEITIIEDLIYLETIAKEYAVISGENEKIGYLINAKDGDTNERYKAPLFFTIDEHSKIVELIANSIDNNSDQNNKVDKMTFKKIRWMQGSNELFTLFSDMLNTGDLIETGKANLARFICQNFTDNKGKDFTFSNVESYLNKKNKSKKRVDFSSFL